MKVKSGGTEIFVEVRGSGPPVFLLHPFPSNHNFWRECAPALETRYQLVLPDLRGHGDSPAGTGPITMEQHARDLAAVCDDLSIRRAAFVGVSIGGYILFEFVRRFGEQIAALVLANTRAGADTAEGRKNRQQANQDVLQRGPGPFIETMLPKLLGRTTLDARPDRVAAVREMMEHMTVQDIIGLQQGMAMRPDSMATLSLITVPTLLIGGDEDVLTPVGEQETMKRYIPGSRLQVIQHAGHYTPLEQPEEFTSVLRSFLDRMQW